VNTTTSNKTVSLVLGSGGARGLVHIGVIEWLVANGFEIRSIAGSSMGALIGGIYATGKLDVYTQWVKALEKIDVLRLLDVSFTRNSLFKGKRIIHVLKEMIGDHNIEELPISYTAVATDLHEQKEIWLNHGPLFDAIRASIAIPTIFSPHEYMGKQLIDGSIVNPVPIAPTLNDKTDITIAVNLNGKPQKKLITPQINQQINSNSKHQRIKQFITGLQPKQGNPTLYDTTLFDIITKSMETMQSKITRLQLAAYSPDVIITVPRNACSFYEFYRAEEMIEIGHNQAEITLFNVNEE